jgi:hypothetical protein
MNNNDIVNAIEAFNSCGQDDKHKIITQLSHEAVQNMMWWLTQHPQGKRFMLDYEPQTHETQ